MIPVRSLRRASRRGEPAVLVGAVALALGVPVAPAVGAENAGDCSRSNPGVVATLGTWSSDGAEITAPEELLDGEDLLGFETRGVASGLGHLAARALGGTGLPRGRPVVLRRVGQDGRSPRLVLCHGGRRLAVVGAADPQARVGGVSVNGDRLVWRTWRPGRRGTVTVGRVSRGRVVGLRRTELPVVGARGAVNGRIVVMPDGTASWSLEVAGRAAVWLWPRGARPRRLTVPPDRERQPGGWDVRIVDDRHVLLGSTSTVLRYGPATPGRCPTPVGAAVDALGGLQLVSVPGVRAQESTDVQEWSQRLVCDPAVGDYVHVHASFGGGDKYGNAFGTTPVATLATAGVLLHVDRASGGSYAYSYATEVTPLATRRPTIARGIVDDPETVAVTTPPPAGGEPAASVGVRVLPGVVAWVTGPAATDVEATPVDRDVWVADADGARVVGRLPADAPLYPALTLTPSTVGWTGPAGPVSVPVRPVPGDVVHRVSARASG
ncbi:hypothetical protein [Patulibacter americanus]|uniref:hypothetical protein n=1 Tax=Patulibacter americanus TaxID=588672 RepID=UPI0004223583|nr:hypothetical protein [Patulibacter americanus]